MRAYNSTIKVKQRACKSCGVVKFIFSKGRCVDCARIEDTLAREEKETEKVIEEEDLSGLIQDADAIFSQFIRLKYANENGIVNCYTCPTFKHWTMMQNGHYMKRSHLYLRFDERNCRPQCPTCNEFHGGNMIKYREHLEREFVGITELLYDDLKIVYKPTRDEIRQIISYYTPKVKEKKKKLKT